MSDSSNYEDCQDFDNNNRKKRKHLAAKFNLRPKRNYKKNRERKINKVHHEIKSASTEFNDEDNLANSFSNKLSISRKFNINRSKKRLSVPKTISPLVGINSVAPQSVSQVSNESGSGNNTGVTTGAKGCSVVMETDQLERKEYIDILATLIQLNMPSNIECNRSNEAYRNRKIFFNNRRRSKITSINSSASTNSNHPQQNEHILSSEKFWSEIQYAVHGHTSKSILNFRKRMVSKVFHELQNFHCSNDSSELTNNNAVDTKFSINNSYISTIQSSYYRVGKQLHRYHKLLSYYPSSTEMMRYLLINYHELVTSLDFNGCFNNLRTMQAWLSCCKWLNLTANQIANMIGLDKDECRLLAIEISERNGLTNEKYCDKSIDQSYGSSTVKPPPLIQQIDLGIHTNIKSTTKKLKLRTLSLCEDDETEANWLVLDTHPLEQQQHRIQHLRHPEEIFCDKLDHYVDRTRRRYGLDNLCSWAISIVAPLLYKYQIVLSITQEENKMPLTVSYAEAVKKQPISAGDYNRGIFSEDMENASEISYSSYKTPLMDEDDFPCFPHGDKLIHSTSPSIYGDLDLEQEYLNDPTLEHLPQSILQETLQCHDNNKLFDKCKASPNAFFRYLYEPEDDNDIKGLLGLRNEVASKLNLPPLLPHYLFLARYPVRVMHGCVRRILAENNRSNLSDLSSLTVKQKINDFKNLLKYTIEAREFLYKVTYGINFQLRRFEVTRCKNFAPQQEIDQSEFMRMIMREVDVDLSRLLRLYMDLLKQLLNIWCKQLETNKSVREEPRRLLEQEWRFVKTYCHSIRQEEEMIASCFCELTEHLFELLHKEITEEHKFSINLDSSPRDSLDDSIDMSNISQSNFNRKMSNSCHTYKKKCKILQSRLKQASDFAKLLRQDLEISLQLELTPSFSLNDLLDKLQRTRHKLIDLSCLSSVLANENAAATSPSTSSNIAMSSSNTICNITSDLNLIIPEESSVFLNDLMHPLTTGFAQPSRDDDLMGTITSNSKFQQQVGLPILSNSREYILIIKKSDMKWTGDKMPYPISLDLSNLKQRLHTSNILFIARRPGELQQQYHQLLDSTDSTGLVHFKEMLLCTTSSLGNVAEACHYNTKRNLSSLKSKVLAVAKILQTQFLDHESPITNIDSSTQQPLNVNQQECLRSAFKPSYSIAFEFHRDLIRICTGEEFTTLVKMTVIDLCRKWFEFSKHLQPSENRTVPRWANDGMSFLLQIMKSRVVSSMSSHEWMEFKMKLDNFIAYSVGGSSSQDAATGGTGLGSASTFTPELRVCRGNSHSGTHSIISSSRSWLSHSHHRHRRPHSSDIPIECGPPATHNLGKQDTVLTSDNSTTANLGQSNITRWQESSEAAAATTANEIKSFPPLRMSFSQPSKLEVLNDAEGNTPTLVSNGIASTSPITVASISMFCESSSQKAGELTVSSSGFTIPLPEHNNDFHSVKSTHGSSSSGRSCHGKSGRDEGINYRVGGGDGDHSDVIIPTTSTSGSTDYMSSGSVTSSPTTAAAPPATTIDHSNRPQQRQRTHQRRELRSRYRRHRNKVVNHWNEVQQSVQKLDELLDTRCHDNNLIGRPITDQPETPGRKFFIKKVPFHWVKKEPIGQGGFGKVFKVCRLDDQSIMAMKEIVLNEPIMHDRDYSGSEYDLLCQMRNAHLLEFYGVDVSVSHLRIFTEFCEGGSLASVSVLDIGDCSLRSWALQILSGLVFMHDHKIAHCDVKPENIFLSNVADRDECCAKLGDFGSAQKINDEFGLKKIKGTVMYMAPEIPLVDSRDNTTGCGYNEKVDIWSLGCVVLYMVTGRPPWPYTERLKIYFNLGQGEIPQIPKIGVKRMSAESRAFIERCLIVNPNNRPAALDLKDMDFVHVYSFNEN